MQFCSHIVALTPYDSFIDWIFNELCTNDAEKMKKKLSHAKLLSRPSSKIDFFHFSLESLTCDDKIKTTTQKCWAASTNFRRERTFDHIERSGSSTTDNEMPITSERITHHTNKKTLITSPKQRYYLGEDPYQGSLFGKENKNGEADYVSKKNYYNSSAAMRRQRSEEPRMKWVSN